MLHLDDVRAFLHTHPATCSWAIIAAVVEAALLLSEVIR